MQLYQSFFLVGIEWKMPKRFAEFAGWLLPQLKGELKTTLDGGPRCMLVAVTPQCYGDREPTFQDDFFKLFGQINTHILESFSILGGANMQFYFKTELLHVQHRTGTQAADQKNLIVPRGIKIAALSLRSDLWQRCADIGIADVISRSWEELFVSEGAVYGYEANTRFPKTDRSSQIATDLIPDERIEALAGELPYVRVADFDYTQYKEGVASKNYISNRLLDRSEKRAQVLAGATNVLSRILRDADHREIGVVVELVDSSEATRKRAAGVLDGLIWNLK